MAETNSDPDERDVHRDESTLIAYFEDLFRKYEGDRQTYLEEDWTRIYNNFYAIDSPELETKKEDNDDDWRSDAWIGVTRQKVLTSAATVQDLMFQQGKFPFEITVSKETSALASELDLGTDAEDQMRLDAREMKKLMDQNLLDGRAFKSASKNILSGCMYGSTWARIVIDVVKKLAQDEDGNVIRTFKDIYVWDYVSNWDMYWDMETNDPNEGRGIFHRSWLNNHDLRNMLGTNGNDPKMVKTLIEGGSGHGVPNRTGFGNESPKYSELKRDDKTHGAFEYWGLVPVDRVLDYYENIDIDVNDLDLDILIDAREDAKDSKSTKTEENETALNSDGNEVFVKAIIVDWEIVTLLIFDNDEDMPYFYSDWESSIDTITGWGQAEHLFSSQRMINKGVRAFEDNKSLAGNVMLAIMEDQVDPKTIQFKPGAKIAIKGGFNDIREVIQQLNIVDTGDSWVSFLHFMLARADEDSMIPKSAQGFSERGTQTAFESSQLVQRAGKYMAMIIKNFDELFQMILEQMYIFILEDNADRFHLGTSQLQTTGYDSFQNILLRSASLQQMMALIGSIDGLANEFNLEAMARDLVGLANFDADRYIKSNRQKNQEAQDFAESEAGAQQRELEELAIAKEHADVELTESEIMENLAKAEKIISETDKTEADASGIRLDNIDKIEGNDNA